jgi:hypothetical protein
MVSRPVMTEDEDAVMPKVREEGGPGFHHDIAVVLIPPHHPPSAEAPLTDDVVVAVIVCHPPLPSSCKGLIDGRAAAMGCAAPWAASTLCSPP